MFLGLSLRQFLCSAGAVAASLSIYFLLKDILGTEITSWLCILACVPFAFFGFVKYHGMNGEEFLLAFIRSELLEPQIFFHEPGNLYMTIFMTRTKNTKKEAQKLDKNALNNSSSGGKIPPAEESH